MVDLNHVTETLEAAARESAPEHLPQLLGALESAKATVWARLIAPQRQIAAEVRSESANMTAAELAAIYRVPRSWFYEAARNGRLPHTRLGRYVRFRHADVARVLADSKSMGLGTKKKRRGNGAVCGAATAQLPAAVGGQGA